MAPIGRSAGWLESMAVYGLAEEYVSQFSDEARTKFFGEVASAFYGLKA